MRRSARNAVGIAALTALVVVLLAAFAGAASADTGDIIEGPANGSPETAGNGWQAGVCAVNVPECNSVTPSQYFTQAAGHPNFGFTQFIVKHTSLGPLEFPVDAPKDLRVDLPVGLNVNPTATPQCEQFVFEAGGCPAETKVGESGLSLSVVGVVTPPISGVSLVPVYNLVPEEGHPAKFGFTVAGQNVYLIADIEWAGDYHEGFTIAVPKSPLGELVENRLVFSGRAGNGSFLTNPSTCSSNRSLYSTLLRADSVSAAGGGENPSFPNGSSYFESPLPAGVGPTGCASVPFAPTVTAAATGATDSSSTVSVSLGVPQHTGGKEAGEEVNSSTVQTANVTLPVGTGLNPATATGLEFCKDGQFPLNSRAAISCPEKSQVGTVAIEAPELPAGSLKGPVYLAEQKSREPLSGQEYRIFFNAESSRYGVQVREEGKVKANPTTGQLTAEFTNLPQVAFSSATLTFGPTAKHAIPVLSSPPLCTNTATSSAVPWSTGAATATGTTELKLSTAPGGGACAKTMAERPFTPNFLAKPNTFKALTYTPYRLTIDRAEGQQEIKGFNITLPPGATAKLAGVPYCQAKEYSAAEGKTGAAEAEKPSCGKESQIGVAAIQSGTGPEPLKLEGKVYLSGPYMGAPLSIVVITPAVAGPFDLGNVVVHAPLNLNPESGQVSTSAEIPDVFGGVKLDIRQIVVNLNRKEFTLNGTNCKKSTVAGTVQGGGGDPTNSAAWSSYSVSTPSQSEGCKGLAFKPGLKLRLFGQTHRAQHPKLKATLTPKEGQANVEVASVALPHTIFLDQSSLGTVCTRPQFAAEECPPKSVYGHAIAYSPLLSQPLEGPVVLRSSNNTLPDMVAHLKGQVNIDLDGKIDTYKRGIRTTFTGIPDLPVSKFVLVLPGGKHGLLQNSTNLCAKPVKGILRLVGHNSRRSNRQQKIQTPCKGKGAKKGKKSNGSKQGKKPKGGKKSAKGGGHKQKAKQ
jgi:hypothetical protein